VIRKLDTNSNDIIPEVRDLGKYLMSRFGAYKQQCDKLQKLHYVVAKARLFLFVFVD